MTPEQLTCIGTLDDPRMGVACTCGCVHLFGFDLMQRYEVLFRCDHPVHKLHGFKRTYEGNNGAVLQGDDVDPDYVSPPLRVGG